MSNFNASDMLLETDAELVLAKQQDQDTERVNGPSQQALRFVPPMLPTLSKAPDGDEWLHEIKYDGFRTQIVFDQDGPRAFTRRGFDWSDRYAAVLNTASQLNCSSAILDGEIIVQDDEGRSDFAALARACSRDPQAIVFMAFDLLHLNGHDIRSEPLTARKSALHGLIGYHDPNCRLQYVEHMIGGGEAVFQAADQLGLEGIVSKRVHSRYASGRSQSWRTVKCWDEAHFLVLAVEGRKEGPSMALLARETNDGFSVAGWAAITLPGTARERLWEEVERLACSHAELDLCLGRDVQPLRPGLRVAAKFLKGGGKLQHATLSAICWL